MTTNQYIRGVKENGWPPFPNRLWQRNYYEHIIRNEDELNRFRHYIADNPANWQTDEENVRATLCGRPYP
jgi:REP element-mobilizing transposase RayT